MSTTCVNGRMQRKSLADQINRLDSILDGLAEGLNDAISTAVKDAVHAALIEVLTNAELQKRLAASQVPNARPRVMARLVDKTRRCWNWIVSAAQRTSNRIVAVTQAIGAKFVNGTRTLGANVNETVRSVIAAVSVKVQQAHKQIVCRVRAGWMLTLALVALTRRFRSQLVVALGVGMIVAITCYLAGREIASTVCGLAGFAGALATSALNRLRRVLPFLAGSDS
jgi:hypothetical protein